MTVQDYYGQQQSVRRPETFEERQAREYSERLARHPNTLVARWRKEAAEIRRSAEEGASELEAAADKLDTEESILTAEYGPRIA